MIGSDEVAVTGLTRAGDEVPLLRDGSLADLTGPVRAVGSCRPGREARYASPRFPGEVPERLNGRDWKSRNGG